jgi:putative transposase
MKLTVFTKYPCFEGRQITAYLPRNGFQAGRDRVRRLMGNHGPTSNLQRAKHQQENSQNRISPYLLRKLPITRANHVGCSDITYIPVRRGFLYLVAIMDRATRKVLARRSTIGLGPMVDKVSLEHVGRQLLRRRLKQGHRKIRQA